MDIGENLGILLLLILGGLQWLANMLKKRGKQGQQKPAEAAPPAPPQPVEPRSQPAQARPTAQPAPAAAALDPRLLAGTESLALSLHERIAEHSRRQGIGFDAPPPRVRWSTDTDMSVAGPAQEAFTFDSPVRLARDAARESARWALIPFDTWRRFYSATEGLADEVAACVSEPDPERAGDAQFAIGLACAHAWASETFVDTACTLFLGVAYPRALVRWYRESAEGERITIRVSEDGVPLPGAPGHWRVQLAMNVLEQIGQFDEARALEAEWLRLTAGQPGLVLRSRNARDWAPRDVFDDAIHEVASRLLTTPLDSLRGGRLDELPGLDDTQNTVSAAKRIASRLAEGMVDGRAEPRTLLTALATSSFAPETVGAALQAVATALAPTAPVSERKAQSGGRRPRHGRRRSRKRALRQALIVSELLSPLSQRQ